MESVGPVDIGDERALPDLSRDEQGEVTEPTLDSAVVKQRLFALSTGCGTALQAVHKSGWGMRVAGRKSALRVVTGSIPWFMPGDIHKEPELPQKGTSWRVSTCISSRTRPAKRWR